MWYWIAVSSRHGTKRGFWRYWKGYQTQNNILALFMLPQCSWKPIPSGLLSTGLPPASLFLWRAKLQPPLFKSLHQSRACVCKAINNLFFSTLAGDDVTVSAQKWSRWVILTIRVLPYMSQTHFLPGAQTALRPIGSIGLSKEVSASVPKLVEEPKGLSHSHQQKSSPT